MPVKLNTRLGTISPRSTSANGDELTARSDLNHAAEDGGVPSTQQNGLAPMEPCRICRANGQRRDVVQRGLERQENIGEVVLASGRSMTQSLEPFQ